MESDNIRMVQRGQNAHLIRDVIFLIVAKSKAFDLNQEKTTFFIATGFYCSFLLTKNTFPYEPTPSFLMNLYSGRAF